MKPKINVQDQFLNQARREKVQVQVDLVDGQKLIGLVKSFDNYCVIVEADLFHLVYKHAISNVNAAKDGKMSVVAGENRDGNERGRDFRR
jgi:host factor-I protein